MESSAAWSVECREAAEAVAASIAALVALTGAGADCSETADTLPFLPANPRGADPVRGADPLRDVADACLDGLAGVAGLEARTAALKVRLAAEYVRAATALAPPAASPQEHTAREMALVAEVACVLTVSERSASALLSDSQALTTALPLTLGALQAGTFSWQHARIMVDESAGLDPASAAVLEAHFLDPDATDPARGCPAGELVPGRFRAKARTWRERHHPVSIEKRHARCAADRRVEFVPDRDGMAWLNAYLPADAAAGIWERTTATARALQGPGEARTLTQLRTDVAATLLLTGTTTDRLAASATTNTGTGAPGGTAGGGATSTGTGAPDGTADGLADDRSGMAGLGGCVAGGVPVPRAQVLVTVPVMSLLGASDEPAMLDGYGPIPPSMARHLIADGADSFQRVLIDPRDGAPLEIGRTSYRLTKAQRQWLRLRDGKCPFPGCNNPSLDNEADHLLAWADGGTTGIANLGQPCRKHHRLKHASAWTPTVASKDSSPGWISPSGRHYRSEHQDWEPPHWPPGLVATNGLGWALSLNADLEAVVDLPPEEDLPPTEDLPPDETLVLLPEPGPDPRQEPPPDTWPDWDQFAVWDNVSAAAPDDQPWPAAPGASFLENLLLQRA